MLCSRVMLNIAQEPLVKTSLYVSGERTKITELPCVRTSAQSKPRRAGFATQIKGFFRFSLGCP